MDSSSDRSFAVAVLDAIEKGLVSSSVELHSFKMRLAKKMHLGRVPTNPDLLLWAPNPSLKARLLLSIKPVRTLSGVAPVAVMTKPVNCRHGTCVYCPGGVDSVFGSVPKSYTGNEPATMRAIANHFDGFLQVFNRLSQLVATGHSVNKIELILMGGTFPGYPVEYQEEFVKDVFWALNAFSDRFFLNGKLDSELFSGFFASNPNETEKEKTLRIQKTAVSLKSKMRGSLLEAQDQNESSHCRMVAFCIETKPDFCKAPEIDRMLNQGCTRVELGVQCLDDALLLKANRGHSLQDSVEATRLLKDSCLKVTYHMMPGLPGSSPKMDVKMFQRLFSDPDFCPDALKIYPCMVLPGTPLHDLYEKGEFVPLSTKDAVEIISRSKAFFPKWVRVQRVMRDIPVKWSENGVRSNNLRQLVETRAQELGIECQCIRCREIGHSLNGSNADFSRQKIRVERYAASKGTELFISSEDSRSNVLFGFCRLRIPFKPFRPEISEKTALIRELHVFGKALELGETESGAVQHMGLGRQLLEEAEKIAAEQFNQKETVVVSGVGAREYYRRLGYEKSGVFMKKKL